MQKSTYILILLILLMSTYSPLQAIGKGITGLPQVFFGIIYAILLFGLFVFIKGLVNTKEGFFFEVNDPYKCHGNYLGKPNSFEFSQVGSGDCSNRPNAPLGFITGQNKCEEIGDGILYPYSAFKEDQKPMS